MDSCATEDHLLFSLPTDICNRLFFYILCHSLIALVSLVFFLKALRVDWRNIWDIYGYEALY